MAQDNPGTADEAGEVERFAPTGRIAGVITAVVGLGGVVLAVQDPGSIPWIGLLVSLLVCWAAWTVFLRPRVSVEGPDLVLRNLLSDVRVPLAAIEEIAVRQVLVVSAAGRRFASPAVGRKRRQLIKDGRTPYEDAPQTDVARAQHSYGLFVEDRIAARAEDARAHAGIGLYSDEQEALAAGVTRTWAWVEIGIGVLLVAAIVGLAVLPGG